jgi:hypothetical protein
MGMDAEPPTPDDRLKQALEVRTLWRKLMRTLSNVAAVCRRPSSGEAPCITWRERRE